MQVSYEKTPINDVIVVKPEIFEDHRGFFTEIYRQDQFREIGLPDTFVQLNHSRSGKNVLRGLHFQWGPPPMGKLMWVTQGAAFLVAVDVRKGSPTLGKWFGLETSAKTKHMLWAPAGFARGFCVLSESAEIQYLCTGTYNGNGEGGILWNDPEIGIEWPISNPITSDRDKKMPTLAEWLQRPESNHFQY